MGIGMLVAGLAVGLLLGGTARGADLEVGDRAPSFSLVGSDGQTHALAQFAGKRGVVLAWFPAAFTPG
jgi:peroxiredoxin Q/BCP